MLKIKGFKARKEEKREYERTKLKNRELWLNHMKQNKDNLRRMNR